MSDSRTLLVLALLTLLVNQVPVAEGDRTFSIDYENNQFLKDGEPFRYVAGEMHYFRVPYQYWQDRLHKLRMGGLNALQTYIEWTQHEPESGEYRFDGQQDIVRYLTIAQEEGLLVTLRPGPYICAERDMGGLPYWLLRDDPTIALRTSDSTYLSYVDRYFAQLLPKLKPLMYENGGPIITVQVENEYGYYGCDQTYKEHLRDLFLSYLGNDTVLFTTDGCSSSDVSCGKIDGVYATVDFGTTSDVQSCFNIQRGVEPQGPNINSEFYTGWLDHWSEAHNTVDTDSVTSSLSQILALNASVSMYMYHGGTDFNFTGGANGDNLADLTPDPTSYDYDAPLSEAGDPTDKYYAIRATIAQYMDVPNGTLPQPSAKLAFGPVTLSSVGTVFNLLSTLTLGDAVVSDTALNFEELSLGYGYVLYQTTLSGSYDSVALSIPGLSDRGYVYINEELVDILERSGGQISTTITAADGDTLSIIVENQGRVNFGVGLTDFKGLRHEVTMDGVDLSASWTHYLLPFNNTNLIQSSSTGSCDLPAVFTGTFVLENSTVLDTFLDPTGWGKGVAVLNDVILGRYWPTAGPQVTLYVPGLYLNAPPATNTLVMIEFEQSNCDDSGDATVTFTGTPYINEPV